MGAQIDIGYWITRTLGGTSKNYQSSQAPTFSFDTGVTTGCALDDSVVIPAGTTLSLWKYAVQSTDWAIAMIQIAGAVSGALELWTKSDTPTSATNLAPTGAAITWNMQPLTGLGPVFLTGRACRTNATPANHAKDNGGSPNAWTGGQGEVNGFIYDVQVKNVTASDWRVRAVFLQ